MRKCYVLTKSVEDFTADSVVFKLWAGSSRRDQTKLKLVEMLALDLGWFFRQQDEDTDFLLYQKAKELFPNAVLPLMHIKCAHLAIGVFYRLIQDNNIEWIEERILMPKGTLKTLLILDPASLPASIFSQVKKGCLCLTRKNLSSNGGRLFLVNALAALLFVATFALDALIVYLFNLK